jgi:hypothetical protein
MIMENLMEWTMALRCAVALPLEHMLGGKQRAQCLECCTSISITSDSL